MRSKRVPDRVHVVRPPEDSTSTTNNSQNIEIVRMLARISDKLKRSEAERYELLGELREYRKSLKDLEEKSKLSEKTYQAIERKIDTKSNIDTESLQRQARFEKALQKTEEKLVKVAAGQAMIDKRVKDTESKQTVIDQRLDQSVAEQARIGRQLEVTAQDKSRFQRKLERLEDIVTETQDTLQAKAMVLLTDQSTAAQGKAALQAPAWGEGSPQAKEEQKPWWQRAASTQNLGMAALVIVALMMGWVINQMQQPKLPSVQVQQDGSLQLAETQNRDFTNADSIPSTRVGEINALEEQKLLERLGEGGFVEESQTGLGAQEASIEENPNNVLDYNDEQLLAALNNDTEQLAQELNNIEPGVGIDLEQIEATQAPAPENKPVKEESQILSNLEITAPLKNFDQVGFKHDPKIAKAVLAEKNSAPLSERAVRDSKLPDAVKDIETQAIAGNPEAQHDLAAIYTAGHGGVTQNFDKAAFWFRESSDNGIANARYNLGVLYHQGLGVERDLGRALYWYREAARLDHAEAQYNLGIAHIEGIGTDYDPRLAAAFFERAANNGVMEAAYNLGLIHENGLLGTPKPDEAILWYKIAADQGSPDAKSALEQLTKDLQIDMRDVDKLVERMQAINESVKGRRAGPNSASAKTSTLNTNQALVAQIQEYLIISGLYSGPADGISGPQTEKAIKSYQEANSLSVDGKATKELLSRMVSSAMKELQ
ncbi:MAG: peptidoglycan-binding protein [Alphaproteobacteria bacterium]|nr:peptidoglycan-binding protein [Alphaproteobacteria bacterium]